MKKLLVAGAVALSLMGSVPAYASDGEVSVLLFGASYHMKSNGKHDDRFNEFNPGIGLEYEKNGFLGGALTYKDSYSKQAYAAYVGYRYYPFEGPVFVSLRAGYLNGSGFHQIVALPSLGFTYKNVSLEFTAIPYKQADGAVAMTWLRISF